LAGWLAGELAGWLAAWRLHDYDSNCLASGGLALHFWRLAILPLAALAILPLAALAIRLGPAVH